MKKEELFELRYYANCMENGIDPTSGLVFPEDTVMNCKKIKSYNGKVRELLDSLIVAIENDGKKTNNRKIPFFISSKEKDKFQYSAKPVSISEFCHQINDILLPGMTRLIAKEITHGLEKLGYLETKPLGEDKNYKCVTDKGKAIGIIEENKVNLYGNRYSVNLYTRDAQEFVLRNLEKILQEK